MSRPFDHEARVALENLRRLVLLLVLLLALSLLMALGQGAPATAFGRRLVGPVHAVMALNLLALWATSRWLRQQGAAVPTWLDAVESWGLGSLLGLGVVGSLVAPWPLGRIDLFWAASLLLAAFLLLRPLRAAWLIGSGGVVLAGALLAFPGGLMVDRSVAVAAQALTGVNSAFRGAGGELVQVLLAMALSWVVSLMTWRRHLRHEALAHELLQSRQQVRDAEQACAVLRVRDPLTQVWTPAEGLRLTQRELTRAQRHGGETCLMLIQPDGSASLRERAGAARIDALLTALALVLVERVRTTDEVARHEPDGFLVLLPQTGLDEARLLAGRLHQGLTRLRPPALADAAQAAGLPAGAMLGVSLGVACQPGRALVPVPLQAERLLASVDQALRQARAQGANQVVVAPLEPTI